MWQPITDISILQTGDYIKISFSPHSQKHFMDPQYDYYFPEYSGKIISNNAKTIDELLIVDKNNKTYYCENRCGSSGFWTGYFIRSPGEISLEQLERLSPYLDS
jgi:hypothetical protein